MGRPWNLDEYFDEFLHIFENPRCFGYTLTRAIWWFRFTCFNWNLWCSFLPPSIFSNVRTLNKLMRYEDRVRISTAIIMQLSTQIVYSIFLAPPCYLMQLEPSFAKLFRLLFYFGGFAWFAHFSKKQERHFRQLRQAYIICRVQSSFFSPCRWKNASLQDRLGWSIPRPVESWHATFSPERIDKRQLDLLGFQIDHGFRCSIINMDAIWMPNFHKLLVKLRVVSYFVPHVQEIPEDCFVNRLPVAGASQLSCKAGTAPRMIIFFKIIYASLFHDMQL